MSSEESYQSPFLEDSGDSENSSDTINKSKKNGIMGGFFEMTADWTRLITYAGLGIIILFILYYAYTSFYQNQESFFLEDTTHDDPSHIGSNFVENYIQKLRHRQSLNLGY